MNDKINVKANTHVTSSHPDNFVVEITAGNASGEATKLHTKITRPKVGLTDTRRTSDQVLEGVMEIGTVFVTHTSKGVPSTTS